MIEQSDIVEIYSDDDIQSVTIRMSKREAENFCNSMGLHSAVAGELNDKHGRFVASVCGGKVRILLKEGDAMNELKPCPF